MTGPTEVRKALTNVDFPASRDAIVQEAERDGAPEDVVKALRAMPPVDYANKDEVIRSAHTDAAPGRDPGARAAQLREGNQRIAAHERDVRR
jgi:hypothetical protein